MYLLVEDRLGLTTITHLLVVVSSLSLQQKTLKHRQTIKNCVRYPSIQQTKVTWAKLEALPALYWVTL